MPVFPCAPLGKNPICTNGHDDATTDPDQINEWWGETPNANVATVPGAIGCCVIDSDPPEGEATWSALCHEHGQPLDTFTVKSPRGGLHRWFTGSLRPTQGKSGLGPYVDTRGDDSYVLLAPSETPDGVYTELTPGMEAAPLPIWVADVLAAQAHRNKQLTLPAPSDLELDLPINIGRAKTYLAGQEPSVEGSGSDQLTFTHAATLRDLGVSAEMALVLLCAFQPLFDQEWLEAKIANAYRYAQNGEGAWSAGSPSVAFAGYVGSTTGDGQPVGKGNRPAKFHFECEDEQEHGVEPAWLIPGLVPDNATVLMVGETGSFKSFIALDMALAVATGQSTCGCQPVRQGPVFYAALEGRSEVKLGRRRAWKAARGVNAAPDFYVGRAPRLVDGDDDLLSFGQEIAKALAGRRPALIVIDTLAKVMTGLNENSAQDTGKLVAWADDLRDCFHCPVLVLHHKDKAGVGARGNTAIVAGFDSILDVVRDKEKEPIHGREIPGETVALRVAQHKDSAETDKPWLFARRQLAGSMVLDLVTREQYEARKGKHDALSGSAIHKALIGLGAVDMEHSVITQVLAEALTPLAEDDEIAERTAKATRVRMALHAKARKELAAYAVRDGRDYMWFTAPSPEQ